MNTSLDDQASQSTTTDQQSEVSSVNPQSPRSASSAAYIMSGGGPSQISAQNNLLMQQTYLNPQESSYMFPHSAAPSSFNLVNDNAKTTSQQQQHRAAAAANSSSARRYYTGVDKLILAAMMEESAAQMATGATGYMPSGRGIGYIGGYAHQQVPIPSNKSELDLFRLLERANLLNYFGTFLNFGGDDVQQLSDADEDEFLEIMSLVGMTQKPLHVRRLQKALIEWRENREAEINNFRRPMSQSVSLGTTTNNTSNYTTNLGHHQQIVVDTSNHSNQQVVVQTLPLMTTATSDTTSLQQGSQQQQKRQQQHYAPLPHEILVGAPKRLRLMDNLHKRSSSTSNTTGQSYSEKQTDLVDQQHSNNIAIGSNHNHHHQQPPSATGDNSIEQLPLSPRSQKSVDRDDDKLIEVMMNSPQSEQELDIDNNTRSIDVESPNSAQFSHNKYGRYKASLQGSPNKVKP